MPARTRQHLLKTACLSFLMIPLLVTGFPGSAEARGGGGDCSWDPEAYCCMCIVEGEPDAPPYPAKECYANYGGGGTFHCGATCPFDEEPCGYGPD